MLHCLQAIAIFVTSYKICFLRYYRSVADSQRAERTTEQQTAPAARRSVHQTAAGDRHGQANRGAPGSTQQEAGAAFGERAQRERARQVKRGGGRAVCRR